MEPNIIDISKEILKIKDLGDYPALLVTICFVSGLYLIAMIWGWHQDKKDVLKVCFSVHDLSFSGHQSMQKSGKVGKISY